MNQLTLVLFVHLAITAFSLPFDLPNNGPKPLIVQKENGGLYLMVPKQESTVVTPTNARVKNCFISKPLPKNFKRPHLFEQEQLSD